MTAQHPAIVLAQRVAELESTVRMLLDGKDNKIVDGHRLAAEAALYGIDEAVARRLK